MATVNEFGATATSLLEYMEEIKNAYRAIDPAWNVEPESPDGLAIAIWSELFANLDEQALKSYQSVDPLSAAGVQLDRLGFISGITRQAATASTATVVFSGVDGTAIPAETKIRNTETDTLWETDSFVTISSGTASVGVTCLTLGPEPAAIGSLSVLDEPVGGVQSVTNAQAASLGRAQEGDAIYRVRRDLSVANPSNNQVDSIFAAVANVTGVKRARIYENPEDAADANGVAGHSLLILADGGTDEDVAAAIASRKNPGTGLNAGGAFANKVQVLTATPAGNPLTVTFYRPVLTTVYVEVTAAGDLYPSAVDDIKEAIVAYAGATLFDTDGTGFDRTGFDIGDLIAAGKLFTPVNRIIGDTGYALSIKIGTSAGAINLDSIDPGFNGLGVFDEANITVITV